MLLSVKFAEDKVLTLHYISVTDSIGSCFVMFKCVRLSRLLAFECTLNHCTFILTLLILPEKC